MLIDIGAISGATPQTTSATWARLMTRDPVTEAQKTRWRSETPHPAYTRPARPEATRPKPTRSRCLDKLRRDPAIVALATSGTAPREMPGRAAR